MLKSITLFLIITVFLNSCEIKNQNNKSLEFPNKKEIIKIIYKSSLIPILKENNFNIFKLRKGNSIVVSYEKNGTTFIDANDYEAFYKECLFFEFNPENQPNEVKYSNSELQNLNCYYVYRVSSKKPFKKIIKVNIGEITAKKTLNKWTFNVNIDSDFKYGGYIERKSTKKISFKK